MMRIVAMSDTHGYHKRLTVPDGDILIHAGDFSMKAKPHDMVEFAQWFKSLPHKHKIITPGNHDEACEMSNSFSCEVFDPVVYLAHESIKIEGITIFASPYSVAIYDPSPWAFDYQREDKRFKKRWMEIPQNTDILVTHGPPKGVLDLVDRPHYGENPHVGDANLYERVLDVAPFVHIFGHIHEGYGNLTLGRTSFYNVSVCDVNYNPNNPITVIEL